MTSDRADVAYRKRLCRATALVMSLQMAFKGFNFEAARTPWWVFNDAS